jgi:hypothetical protein
MARIRNIRPEFFEDEGLAKLPPHDRLLFIGLWCLADKNGVLEYRPAWIKAKLFPYEEGKHLDASQMLPRLFPGKYVATFAHGGKVWLHVRTFTKHQRISGKEAQTETGNPLPPDGLYTEKQPGSICEAPGCFTDAHDSGVLTQDSGLMTHDSGQYIVASAPGDGFDEFWDAYDKKENRRAAERAWGRLSAKDRRAAIDGIAEYQAHRSDRKFWKHPQGYLNGRLWENEYSTDAETSSQELERDYPLPSAETIAWAIEQEKARKAAMTPEQIQQFKDDQAMMNRELEANRRRRQGLA